MKRKYIGGMAICLVILSLTIWGIIMTKQTVSFKTYVGTSVHWKVAAHMVKNGTTAITILPRREFDYPENLKIDIQELDKSIHTENIPIKPINSYDFKYPTYKSFNRNLDRIMFNLYFVDGTYEVVELKLED